MTAHPNAHILAQLAEIAKTDPEPWKRLEVQIGNNWVQCGNCAPLLDPTAIFRIKRTITLTVNGRVWVLPEPLSETPKHDQLVFYISDDGTVRACRWNNWAVLPTLYKEQRLHDTEADALAWSEFDKWCRGGGV